MVRFAYHLRILYLIPLVLALLVVGGCDSGSPTPTPVPSPTPPAPTAAATATPEVGAVSMNKSEPVAPGDKVALTVQVSGAAGAPTSYDWTVSAGTITEGQGESAIIYQAPDAPDLYNITVTITVGTWITTRTGTVNVVAPTPPSPPPSATAAPPTATPAPLPTTPTPGAPLTGELAITSPAPGAEVVSPLTVTGTGGQAAQGGTKLYILVQPHDYDAYVQGQVSVRNDGAWSLTSVFVGTPRDQPGLEYDICAVLTEEQLLPQLKEMPAGDRRTCITVKRRPDPTPTPRPTLPPGGPTPVPGNLTITSPKEGDQVDMTINVSGTGGQAALTGGTNLYVLVRPQEFSYYVQTLPEVRNSGAWTAPAVFVGQEGNTGLAFTICAVLTSAQLERGQAVPDLPAGQSTCIGVTRK